MDDLSVYQTNLRVQFVFCSPVNSNNSKCSSDIIHLKVLKLDNESFHFLCVTVDLQYIVPLCSCPYVGNLF